MTAQQAKNEKIFVIIPTDFETYKVQIGSKEFDRSRPIMWQVEETNLYDHVMASAEETTSPRGVENKMHIREKEILNEETQQEELVYQVWDWGFRGQYPKLVETFETEEKAEDFIFERTEEFDFANDDQRDTSYYSTYDEAMAEAIRIYAESNDIAISTAESIFKHKAIADKIRTNRQAEAAKYNELKKQRIHELAPVYAKLIEKKVREPFKETCTRLSQAIGDKIESDVFFAAVKLIRK